MHKNVISTLWKLSQISAPYWSFSLLPLAENYGESLSGYLFQDMKNDHAIPPLDCDYDDLIKWSPISLISTRE